MHCTFHVQQKMRKKALMERLQSFLMYDFFCFSSLFFVRPHCYLLSECLFIMLILASWDLELVVIDIFRHLWWKAFVIFYSILFCHSIPQPCLPIVYIMHSSSQPIHHSLHFFLLFWSYEPASLCIFFLVYFNLVLLTIVI